MTNDVENDQIIAHIYLWWGGSLGEPNQANFVQKYYAICHTEAEY